jgi:glycosyltransferase involved in cell wall biosynthesis
MPPTSPKPRIALAHDWLCGYRGGEAVLDRIARLIAAEFTPAGLYVMIDDGRPLTPAIDSLEHITSFLQNLPGGPGRLRRWYLPLYPRAVAHLSAKLAAGHRRKPIDLVISTSSAAIKGLRPPPGVHHLCYCHSPPRYLWSQQEEYARGRDILSRLRRAGLSAAAARLRDWDVATAANATEFLANSTYTAGQIRACYGRDAAVVHPPVRTDFFTPDPTIKRQDFWLVVSALEPYKRIDLAIRAANQARHELLIAGEGSQSRLLRSIAGPTIRFLGRVDDERLRELYRTAALLLFPQVEDFGIVAAEAQACAMPVVARGAGGVRDIVEPGITGAFFDEPTPEAILDAVARIPKDCGEACRNRAAELFGLDRLDAALRTRITAFLGARDEVLGRLALRPVTQNPNR